MQNIHVKRYSNPEAVGYQGTIEPEDRTWLLFLDLEGRPSLYLQAEGRDEDGKVVHDYLAA